MATPSSEPAVARPRLPRYPSSFSSTSASPLPIKSSRFVFSDILKVPKRVFATPKGSSAPISLGSWRSTNLRDVKLEDVLEDKLLPPLSLRDFEGYLVFREHSAENLYFRSWMSNYEKLWNSYMADGRTVKKLPTPNDNTDPLATRHAAHLPAPLATMLRQGLDTFFAPDARLELNLSSTMRAKTLVDAGNSGDPEDFMEVKATVDFSLHRSLRGFCRYATTNAGPSRRGVCFGVSILMIILGLAPALLAILLGWPRAVRIAGYPLLVLGIGGAITAPRRVCAAIWLLGCVRQVDPWDLYHQPESHVLTYPPSPALSTKRESTTYEGSDSFQSSISGTPYPWEKVAELESAPTSPSPGYSSKFRSDSPSPERQFWGPVSPIFNHDVQKALWVVVIQAFGIGLFCTMIVGGVLLGVPNL